MNWRCLGTKFRTTRSAHDVASVVHGIHVNVIGEKVMLSISHLNKVATLNPTPDEIEALIKVLKAAQVKRGRK
jgi:hypothetical protein